MRRRNYFAGMLVLAAFLCLPVSGFGQSSGTLRGVITLADGGTPLHNAIITIVQLKRRVDTDEHGAYEFKGVPPGTYTILAHLEGFPDTAQTVTVPLDGTATADFQLRLSGIREEVTVTVTGSEQTTFEAFQAVSTLDSIKLAEESHPGLGEVLEKEPGVAKRSFGPGSSRPVIRGFDGDRVLVLKDGIRIGALGSQSGDHGEPVDVLSLERLEVVKGPATLLYGSNAIGGVVNAVTGHDEQSHAGARGYFSALGGTTNDQGGISGGVEYGYGNWLFWGNGSGQRTGDYDTPLGRVPNSKSRVSSGTGGLGYYGNRGFFSASYSYDNSRFGIPFASQFEGGGEEGTGTEAAGDPGLIDLALRRHNLRFIGGLRNADSFITGFKLTFDYSDYQHKELEGTEVGTVFDNDLISFRGMFDQRRVGKLSGRFGFEGVSRDYETVGAESLVQGPVDQHTFAAFGLEELNFERVKFQFGGRVEHNRYRPGNAELPGRSFTGFSGAAGIHLGLWKGGAFVANYTHAYRAPALEELYNFGPHIGNLTFEVGNPRLTRERSDGIDLSLRHTSDRLRAVANFYYYDIKDFVFLAPTGEIEDGLIEAQYLQSGSRFLGTEVDLDFAVHPNLWVNLGFDTVDAQLKDTNTPLPRIPPLRGRFGLDARYNNLSVRPEAILVKDQDELFPTETRTAGYALFNVLASYTIPHPHYAHIFSVNAFNLGDRVYRNHLSFIKELAPEIGRGVRFTYTVRFF